MPGVIFGVVLIFGVVSAGMTPPTAALTRGSRSFVPKDNINQWNIVQVGSPSSQNTDQPQTPGFVWVQVPVANLAVFGNTQISQSQKQNTDAEPLLTSGISGSLQQDKNNSITAKPSTTVSSYGENLNKLCLKPIGQFPSNSCNKFVNCWNGVATEQECQQGLLFSPGGYCDYPEHVNCNGKPIEGLSTSSPTVSISEVSQPPPSSSTPGQFSTVTAPTVTSLAPVDLTLKKLCRSPRGQFPGTSCKKYVNCWDGFVVEQECPEGLLFSNRGYCDYPQNVECQGTSKVVSKEPLECPLEFGIFGDKTNCSIYYSCVSYKIAATYVCSDGFKFSQKLGICDFHDRVDCAENLAPKAYFSDSTVEENRQCSVKYGTFRDVNNCSKYYTCANFKIVAQHDCPPGYKFNENIGYCDYSYNVNCNTSPKIFEVTSNSILQVPLEYRERVNSCTPGTVFPLNSQCSMACLCRQGLAEIVQCPAGFAYDSRTDKCILTHLARC